MKIITMQEGGQIPFVDYIPVVQDVYSRKGATKASSSSKKDSEDLIGKSIQKTLEQNGLESDVAVFAQYAEAILQDNLFGYDDGGLNGSVAQLFKLRSLANKVQNSNALYKEALSHMKSADTSSDYAISSDGKVYAAFQDDEGNAKVDAIRLDTYKENSEKYRLLTNSELLQYRRLNKAFDDSILQDIVGSIGMEEIVSDINNVIAKFGTRKSSSYPNLNDSVAKGMEYLFKINVKASSAYQDVVEDGEKKKDISAAIKYIYSSLNNNAKNMLKLHAELNDTSVVEYLKDAIVLNTSYEYDEDFEKAPKGKGSGSGSGSDGGEKLTDRSFINTVVLGEGVEDSTIVLSGHGNVGIKTTGQVYGFRDEEGNRIAMNNLEQILSQKNNALGNTVDLNSISIGNTLVNNLDLHKLVYDGSSTLNRMVLPIDEDVYAATGRIKPDLDALKKFQEFKK